MTIEATPSGVLTFKSQLVDYQYRGDDFEAMNLLQFVVDTWETEFKPNRESNAGESTGAPTIGRPRHARARYQNGHPKADTAQRVRRAMGHNVLPNIIGPFLPRNDHPETFNYYCAFMLILMKPWRDVRDIQIENQSWAVSFGSFMLSASKRHQNIISAAQYYYQCQDAASREQQQEMDGAPLVGPGFQAIDSEEVESEHDPVVIPLPPPTEAELEALIFDNLPAKEIKNGTDAVAIARTRGLLGQIHPQESALNNREVKKATREDIEKIANWRAAMKADGIAQKAPEQAAEPHPSEEASVVIESLLLGQCAIDHGGVEPEPVVGEGMDAVDTSMLKADQLRAYRIVEQHLTSSLSNSYPEHDPENCQEQLLMQIQGEGGTGKSMVIRCITELFSKRGAANMLQKGAYTGIAASLIDGSTLHTLCHIPMRGRAEFGETRLKALRQTWEHIRYFIVDEVSMVSRAFLKEMSSALEAAKSTGNGLHNSEPFGGIHVILAGDFHQFPPVASGPSAALYWENNLSRDSHDFITGRKIYEQFRTVVILKEQCRTKDPEWLAVLRHARHGLCKPEHLKLLRSLVIDQPTSQANDMGGTHWEDAVLVTPRHSVRMAWNECANRQHCARNRERLFVCPAEDTLHGRPLTIDERWSDAQKQPNRGRGRVQRCRNGLPDRVEVAIGMEVMVTVNVETELDVANGARGVVEGIILDRREGADTSPAEVKLQFPPECVLVKLHRTKAARLEGLDERVIPIVPMERKYNLHQEKGKLKQVTRQQLPITSAYAFTDYRSQGQTIKQVIVDIGRPPTGGLTPFNAYVALSRSSGRETIRLLRDFDEDLFTTVPCHKLEKEDKRLYDLDRETK